MSFNKSYDIFFLVRVRVNLKMMSCDEKIANVKWWLRQESFSIKLTMALLTFELYQRRRVFYGSSRRESNAENCISLYAGNFTGDNQPDGVENATHNTFTKVTWLLSTKLK
jgi:hypothetical protein